MRKCEYCGHQNSDDKPHCAGCDTELLVPTARLLSESEPLLTVKRFIIILLLALLATASVVICHLVSCDTVRVTDAVSGLPIAGARVLPNCVEYFDPDPYVTDRRGIARIGWSGFGWQRWGYELKVTAVGYSTTFLVRPVTANRSHLEVSLQQVPKR